MDHKEFLMLAGIVIVTLGMVFVGIQLNQIRESSERDAYYSQIEGRE